MGKEKSLESFKKYVKFFNGVMYFAIACEVLLFLALGVRWLSDKDRYSSGGAGAAMALLYTGPMVIMNFITVILFIILSSSASNNMDRNRKMVMELYKKGALLFGLEFLLGILANVIIFI